jgi:hypothetical protein
MVAFVLSGGASFGAIQAGMLRALYERDIAPELIVLPPPCPLDVLPSEFSHAGELIEQAYELASTALDHPDPAAYWTPRSLQRLQPHSH